MRTRNVRRRPVFIFTSTWMISPTYLSNSCRKLSPPRRPGDEVAFNAIALRVMEENGVEVDDLYAFAKPRLAEIQQPANVHFTTEGSEALAKRVAASILRALER